MARIAGNVVGFVACPRGLLYFGTFPYEKPLAVEFETLEGVKSRNRPVC
jgi:hypothetical protein